MEDRMCLIKRNFADILLFRATVLIDIQTESLQIPKTPVVLQLSGLRSFASSTYNAYISFMKSLRPNWRTDTKANMLVMAIMLFNPDTPNLQNPDIIRLHQFNYVYLLKRYLEFRCCLFCNSRCDFYDLMMKIGEFQETIHIRENIIELAFQFREAVGPLTSEILGFL
ncbi:nuclear hormone receptor HR96-like [Panonychus citri]|uniref:nuclear hormone receptor HR96-like n=1 Tax=Panonychus citri TaxID=50023 RepID=UPI002307F7ED|nr:nuclear hormone receptor HR96-like [Panonychus citri]